MHDNDITTPQEQLEVIDQTQHQVLDATATPVATTALQSVALGLALALVTLWQPWSIALAVLLAMADAWWIHRVMPRHGLLLDERSRSLHRLIFALLVIPIAILVTNLRHCGSGGLVLAGACSALWSFICLRADDACQLKGLQARGHDARTTI